MATALGGNYFSLPVLLGVDFLFGSIAVLIIARLYGVVWGTLAAFLASSYTYFLWQHPYAILLFTGEALFVGLFLNRKNANMVLLDGIFWIFIGMPMVWLFYFEILGLGNLQVSIVMLKDAVNGIFNALLAGLIVAYLPLRAWAGRSPETNPLSLHQTLFNLLVGFVLFPTLILMILDSRREVDRIEEDIQARLEQESSQLAGSLRRWQQQHLHAVTGLAQVATSSDMKPSEALQQKVDLMRLVFPDFHAVYIADMEGTAVAFSPPTNEEGESAIGLNFRDRPYFKELKATLRPVVSDLLLGRVGAPHPIVTIAVPVLVENRFQGFAFGALDLGHLSELLKLSIRKEALQATVVDRQNRVIGSTEDRWKPRQEFDRYQNGEIHWVRGSMFQWLPEAKDLPAMERWKKSFYVQETPLGDLIPWTLVVEEPLFPYQRYVQGVYLKRFVAIVALTVLALILSAFLSRRLVSPLSKLAEVTTNLPGKLLDQGAIHWPNSAVVEMNALIYNFKLMVRILKQNFQEIQSAKEELEKRTQELLETNEELETEIAERRRAEEALRESEERLRLTLKATHMGTWDWNVLTGQITWSDSLEAIFGLTPGALEGTYEAFLERVHPGDRKLVSQSIARTIQEGADYDIEFRIVWPGGAVHWITSKGQVFHDETGRAVRMVGVSMDITQRKRSEQRLATQHAVTRILSESTTVGEAIPRILQAICESLGWEVGGFWNVGRDAHVLRCIDLWHTPSMEIAEFEAVSRQYTFPPGIGLPGRVWSSGESAWIADVVKDRNFPRASFAAKNGLHVAFGFPILLGSEILGVIEFFSHEIQEPDQELLEMMTAIGSQIGQFIERKRAEEERAQLLVREQTARAEAEAAQQRLAFLASASEVLAASLDYEAALAETAHLVVPHLADWCAVDIVAEDQSIRNLEIAHVDPAKVELAHKLRRLYPIDPNASYGVPNVLRTGQPEIYPEIPDALLAATARDAEHLRILRELNFKSAMVVPLQVRERILGAITFVSAESGRRYSSIDLALAVDLARRAAIAIDNARLFRELREASRRKDEFLAMLAHELRNPLAPIVNSLQILRLCKADDSTLNRSMDVVERQVQHMARLLDDLLDVSRITRGKIQLRKELLELAAVVACAVETSRPFIEAQNHELLVSLPQESIHLEADPVRLEQILVNLLNNAAKYTEPGGRIWLTCAREGKEITLRVRDTGIGIPQEMLPQIFDLFTQVNPSLARSQGGLGIGLTLVRNLVEMHGGKVSAYSAGPGQGSEFVVHLPIVNRELQTAGEAVPRSGIGHPPSRRILIVDDNVDAAKTLGELLELYGYEVHLGYDGPTAIKKALAYRPQVVLLDIGLPGMNGYEVARALRQQESLSGMLLAALTGYGQEEDRNRSREAGFDYHFTKPVDLSALQQVLDAAEGRR